MKFLLTPITMIIWFLLTYLGIYLVMVLMLWMFSLSWIWLIIGYTFLIGILTTSVSSLPAFINILILKLYNANWFSVIVHSLAGLFGIIFFYYMLYLDPPTMISGNESTPILKALWAASWLKTIFLIFPFIGFQLALIYQAIFNPITMKLELDENTYPKYNTGYKK